MFRTQQTCCNRVKGGQNHLRRLIEQICWNRLVSVVLKMRWHMLLGVWMASVLLSPPRPSSWSVGFRALPQPGAAFKEPALSHFISLSICTLWSAGPEESKRSCLIYSRKEYVEKSVRKSKFRAKLIRAVITDLLEQLFCSQNQILSFFLSLPFL